jgi:hypothetical protein
VRLTVERRTPQNSTIDRGDVTNSDANSRAFRVNGDGSIVLIASADNSDGLEALVIEGGFTCNAAQGGIGTTQQGVFNGSDPTLPGQRPKSSSFQRLFPVQCVGGTYTGFAHACATSAKGGVRSCTKDATFR